MVKRGVATRADPNLLHPATQQFYPWPDHADGVGEFGNAEKWPSHGASTDRRRSRSRRFTDGGTRPISGATRFTRAESKPPPPSPSRNHDLAKTTGNRRPAVQPTPEQPDQHHRVPTATSEVASASPDPSHLTNNRLRATFVAIAAVPPPRARGFAVSYKGRRHDSRRE
jgi:hypothetical protein